MVKKLAVKAVFVGLLCSFAFLGVNAKASIATADSKCKKLIDQLKEEYAKNSKFMRLITSAFENIQQLPPEYKGGNPWRGKEFPDLVNFFEEWR